MTFIQGNWLGRRKQILDESLAKLPILSSYDLLIKTKKCFITKFTNSVIKVEKPINNLLN